MRCAHLASALCFGLMMVVQPVSSQPAAPAVVTPTPQSTTPALPLSDAAAKHAKRTACLKDAKTKKLVGADKTAFLKNCIEAP
jgi:hypothetical protein